MSIYLIKRLWVDCLENYDASGYDVVGFVCSKEEAIRVMENAGFYVGTGHPFPKGQKVQRIKYEELKEFKEKTE